MKKTAGGVVSAQQHEWIDALRMAGIGAHVCEGARGAKALVSKLLDASD
jgi:hypothetical protein